VPVILRYATHAKEPSLYNTPNTFGVLVLKLVLEWMRDEGGLPAIGGGQRAQGGQAVRGARRERAVSAARAAGQPLAHERDVDGRGAPEAEREAITNKFLKEAQAAGFDGLKGHRSVGGLRASIYNAFPEAGVDALVEFINEFERKL
jgi:phosphoserine aminotransferase